MILMIADGRPCTLRSVLCQTDQKVAFLELQAPQFSPTLNAVLEDDRLELAVIECFVHFGPCLELLEEIKRQRPDVPVLFAISSASDHAVCETLSRGARHCYRKPLDVVRFKEQVKALLALKRAAREHRVPLPSVVNAKPAEDTGMTTDMPENILRAVSYIEDHAADRGLSVDRLAGIAGMSPFHFCRIFKKHTNKSPMQFVNCVRIEKAKEFLTCSSGNMSVTMIANTVGFGDSSCFNKHFKKITGLTPTGFKRSVKPTR